MKLVCLGGCRDGFIKYLEYIDSTYKSLTALSEPSRTISGLNSLILSSTPI